MTKTEVNASSTKHLSEHNKKTKLNVDRKTKIKWQKNSKTAAGAGRGQDMRRAAKEGQAAPFRMASGLSLVEIITLTYISFSDRHMTNDLRINIVYMVMRVLQR